MNQLFVGTSFKHNFNIIETPQLESSESESEISSDEDMKKKKETIPELKKIRKKKPPKVTKFIKPVPVQPKTNQKRANIEDVFEKVTDDAKRIKLSYPPRDILEEQKPISLNVPEAPSISNETEPAGFGFIHPLNKPSEPEPKKDLRDEREEERLEREEVVAIPKKELDENRLSEKGDLVSFSIEETFLWVWLFVC